MQNVTFKNGRTLEVESVSGGGSQGRETLVFAVPEAGAAFEELKEIFLDREATSEILIEYQEGEETRTSLQAWFCVPVALSFAAGIYEMTLGKYSETEIQYAEILERLDKGDAGPEGKYTQSERDGFVDGLMEGLGYQGEGNG